MALIGSITNWGEIQGQINDANGVLTGVISSAELLGGEIVGLRGLKGDKGDQGDTGAAGADGQDGADGFSPSASVSKVGDTATITITDKDGTTTAEVHDGHDGNVFIAELGVTTYQEVVDAADDGATVLLSVEIIATGEKQYYSLVQIYNHRCVFACQRGAEIYFYLLYDNNAWDSQTFRAQEALVSGTNIKTINNTSLLGSGNIDIQGGGGASAFIAEYGVTTYADVKDAYDEDAIILCTVDDSGNTVICQLAYYDDANDTFIFAQPVSEGSYWTSISIGDTWDDGYFYFASTETATQLRNGLMDALDKQKLDGIASGAEVNVQSDWNEADSTADDYIKNKPTIPSQPSDIGAQEALVSGTNIKTINGTSVLGSGDISAGGDPNVQSDWNQSDNTADDYIKNKPTIPTLDMFYPVGSYYETSDGTFDPNVSWGGTWVLETEGQVHVSGSKNGTYIISGAPTDTNDGGSKYLQAHTHSFTQPTITSYLRTVASYGSGSAARPYTPSGSSSTTDWAKASGGAVGAVSGATTGNGNNMPPYIIVHRWHRTA